MPQFSQFYLAYIRSPEWRKRREVALFRASYRCSICGKRRGLQVHHKTYERLGSEALDDLQVVCRGCHWWITWGSRLWRWFTKFIKKPRW